MTPEFTIEVVSDPTGVNFDATYGFKSRRPTVSVFRRPRPAANLKYVMTPDEIFNIKTGELTARDPDTGEPVGMNLMADSRHLTLKQQAVGAYGDHLEGRSRSPARGSARDRRFRIAGVRGAGGEPSWAQPRRSAWSTGPGPRAMADGRVHVLANNQRDPVFRTCSSPG